MKRLVIVGAGGFGREMFAAARESFGFGRDFDSFAFLDARADALDGFEGYPAIIGSPDAYVPAPDDVFVTALGDVESRRRCVRALQTRGAVFVAVVHRTATLGPNVSVGAGSFIAPRVTLTADVRVGRHADVFHNTSVGHDAVIRDFAHVYAQCAVGGCVVVGEGARVYPGAVVVPRRRIGDRAVVGAGSVVFLDVPPGVTVHGNPASPVE